MRLFDMDSKEDYLLDGRYKVCTPYAPCVDVVEVVRCKDCNFALTTTSDDIYYCKSKRCHVFADWTCKREGRKEP